MENDTPRAQPRRQSACTGGKVALGNVNPCIVYLEASLADAVPILFGCWARSSVEVRKVGLPTHLKLGSVLVLMGRQTPPREESQWRFIVHEKEHLVVDSETPEPGDGGLLSLEFHKKFFCGVRSEIKFIDQETDLSLARLVATKPSTNHPIAKAILEIATADWPSMKEAVAFLQQPEIPRTSKQVEPTEGELQYNRGEHLFKKGEFRRALEELQLSLKYNEVRYQALNLIGLSFLKLGMIDFAVKQLVLAASELLTMDELKMEIVYSLGLAYEASKQPDKALDQWKNIYEYDMSFRDVAKRVEDSYGSSGEQAA